MAVPVVEAGALVRRFGANTALAGLDLRAEAGEVVSIFGPNGAGKTTLLRILATLLSPTAGSVSLFGENAFGRHASRCRRRIGVVAHECFLYPDLTATENLLFYARLYGLRDGAARAENLLGWAELGEYKARPVRTYSRGMLQRLALARALLHTPDLLLLDEPFAGLDSTASAAVEEVLERMRAEGRTALLATHDLDRGLRLSNRVYILHRGRVAWEAPGRTDPTAFVDVYRRAVGIA